jgi:hypothetical protein
MGPRLPDGAPEAPALLRGLLDLLDLRMVRSLRVQPHPRDRRLQ